MRNNCGSEMSDALDDIFRMIRLESCVYFQRDFHAPWGMCIEGTGFAQFHLVAEGSCVVESADAATPLGPGDVVLFPRGAGHILADKAGRRAAPGPQVMASFATGAPMFTGPGPAARIICGHYGYRVRPGHPLIDALPDMIHIPAGSGADLSPVVNLLIVETAADTQGGTAIVERLAEVLLVHVLRAWVDIDGRPSGILQAMSDRRLVRAVNRIHRNFEAPLTLEELASEAGMSRSSFAERFRRTAGIAVIEYLSKWRMLSACGLLSETGLSIADVAERSGYGSDLAFSRAFKREHGVSPAEWRRRDTGA